MTLSKDYILGLIEGEGSFTNDKSRNGERRPMFSLKMHVRDKFLVESVLRALDLYPEHGHKIYEYKHNNRYYVFLVIRDLPCLKNKIVPFFKGSLIGYKGKEFDDWLKNFPYLNSLQFRKLGAFSKEYYTNYALKWPVKHKYKQAVVR